MFVISVQGYTVSTNTHKSIRGRFRRWNEIQYTYLSSVRKCVEAHRCPKKSLYTVQQRCTVQCRYNGQFSPEFLKIHPIGRPLGQGMGCILWFQTLIYTLSQSLQWFMQWHVILDRVITALDCIMKSKFPSYCPAFGASDMGLSASVPLPIVMGIFVLLGFQSS